MKIFKEQAGVITKDECWVCLCDCYMYMADTLEQLIEVLNTEWEDDKHLIA